MSCTGAADYGSVLHLVAGGMAMLLVKATISGPPQSTTAVSAVVPVSDVVVLAGTQPNGAAKFVQVATNGGGNALPAGQFLLLLGAFADQPATYTLADGMQGSFVLNGQQAEQRCPNYADPSNPLVAGQAVRIDRLIANCAKAINEYGATPLPRPTRWFSRGADDRPPVNPCCHPVRSRTR